ncbi:MAG: squalene synthase HpnC [Burkholderiales bacterium]
MAVDHYENFPVASILLPRRLRRPVELIYQFARQADDFADEGDWPPEKRMAELNAFAAELDRISRGERPLLPLFQDLAPVIRLHQMPISLFRDLLSAFAQDVTKTRYENFSEVLDYCRRSANPVGQLLLHLYNAASARNLAMADAICTSLQLINFLQDVEIDFRKNRVYLPQQELAQFGVSETQIRRRDAGGSWLPFMTFQLDRAQRMLQSGAPLGNILPGRIGLELRMIVMGGSRIIEKLRAGGADIFRHRPRLTPPDWVGMFWRAVLTRK